MACERAAIEHHLRKGIEVIGGRDQTCAAVLKNRRTRETAGVRTIKQLDFLGRAIVVIGGRKPLLLLLWNVERGILHAERRKDAIVQELSEAFAAGARNEHAKDLSTGIVE